MIQRIALRRTALSLSSIILLVGCAPSQTSEHAPPGRLEVKDAAPELRQMLSEETGPETLRHPQSLDGYIALALERSAELQSSYYAYLAASEKVPQVTALPDPTLSYGYFLRSAETRVGPQRHRLALSQAFPWFGTLGLRGDAADAEARAERFRFLSLKNDLAFRVTTAYAELAYLQHALSITQASISLVQSWEVVLRERFRSGTGSHSDLVRVQVELGELEDRLRELEDLMTPSRIALNALLNRALDASLTVSSEELASPEIREEVERAENLEVSAVEQSPALEAIDAMVEARAAGIELAEKKYFPDLAVGLDYTVVGEREGAMDSGQDAVAAMVSMNVPLYYDKYTAQEAEARLKKRSIESERRDALLALQAEFARAQFALRDAQRKINLYERTLVPKAEESIEASYRAYEAGESGFLDVLDSERRLLDFRLSLRRAQSDRAIAVASIFRLVGLYDRTPGASKGDQ